MRDEKRLARMHEIEVCAYDLFAELGFERTSMLTVANRAKASNETMYRWYGDKHGLFESMVRANASESKMLLETALAGDQPQVEAVSALAPVLLRMLLSEKAILLNRAAASDPSGGLGQLLAKGGRENVLPLIQDVLLKMIKVEGLRLPTDVKPGALFVQLLVGDQQIRRVIGTLAPLEDAEILAQAKCAIQRFRILCVA
jgi:AcrR family transcriptional regulator